MLPKKEKHIYFQSLRNTKHSQTITCDTLWQVSKDGASQVAQW